MMKLRPIHPFPARMASSVIWNKLPRTKRPLRVLDPMAGSGTTIVVARAKGHRAIGFDRDPLAVLLAQAWCMHIDRDALEAAARRVLGRARARWRQIPMSKAYPQGADKETRKFVRFWFDKTNRRQLAALSQAISRLRDKQVRLILWCAFSRLIITKQSGASLAMDVSHSRPHRVYDKAPIQAVNKFMGIVKDIVKSSPFKLGKNLLLPKAQVKEGDARKLPLVANCMDMVITSPPYLNAIDYLRGHKLSLVWMGYKISKLRKLRATSVGAEISQGGDPEEERVANVLKEMGEVHRLSNKLKGMLANYVRDMDDVISEISRVLVPKGKAIFAIGDSTMRGIFIRNSRALIHLAESHGLKLISKRSRALPASRRYLPPPSLKISGAKLQSRMRREVILCMKKIA